MELLLFLVCREALLILPAFQLEEQKEVEVTCPANQKGSQPLDKMRIRHHPVYRMPTTSSCLRGTEGTEKQIVMEAKRREDERQRINMSKWKLVTEGSFCRKAQQPEGSCCGQR